ncbi:uncharacterized protein G2W53_010326 [Senna tora]|uniref:Uncharacterized protein n=1 Tax=Senna tora TaxID=362788 RepID=A0A834X0R9_9FABA|nr:uncharacterized protein G2W53_010326 [Senna tora]
MMHAPPMPRRLQLGHQNHSGSRIQRVPTCLTDLRNKSFASYFVKVSEIRSRFFVRNTLRHDPRSSHAKTTPIGASKPLRFANRRVSEIRPRFIVRNTLRHDPRSSHAKTTPIGASKPLRFANTTRTDVSNPLAQQVFCLIIREGFEIRLRFFVRNTLRHDPRSSHAKTTPIGASKPLRFTNTMRTDVFDSLAQQVFCLVIREGFRDPTVSEIRPQFVVQNTLRHDRRSSHAKTTPIGASKPLRFANTTRTDMFDPLAQQVLRLVSEIRLRFFVRNTLRHDPRSSHAKTTPIGASKPFRFANTTRTDVFDSLAQQVFCLVSEIRPRFVVRNTSRHDPRSSHAKTTPIGASNRLRFANTTRTDVFESLAQQVFCLVIRKGFRDPTAICRPKYVET